MQPENSNEEKGSKSSKLLKLNLLDLQLLHVFEKLKISATVCTQNVTDKLVKERPVFHLCELSDFLNM